MKYLAALLFVFSPGFSSAQPAPELWLMTRYQTDSLRSAAYTGKNDSLVMEACENLGFYYYESNTDSALFFLQKDLALAKKLRLKIWEADACLQIGTLFQYKSDLIKCYEYLMKAKALVENKNSEAGNWHPWNFHNRNTFRDARIAILSDTYNNVGMFYSAINEHPKSKLAYYESIRLSQSINDNIGLGVVYLNIAREYGVDSLLMFSRKALQYQDKSGYYRYRGSALLQIAGAYYDKGQYDSATVFVYRSMAEDEARNNLNDLSYSYNGVALFYIRQHETDSAFLYANKLMSVAHLTQNASIFLAAYNVLSNAYAIVHNVDSAYKYERLSNQLNDSLKNSKINQLTNYQTLAFNEQLRLKQLNDDKTAYQNQLQLYSVIGGLAVALLIAVALYRNNRQTQKVNLSLQQQKQKAESALTDLKSAQAQLVQSEKMASLGELTAGIAHEIQNPLNFVNNFSEVNDELIEELNAETDPEEIKAITRDIRQNNEKIAFHGRRAGAIVKGMLQHSRQTKGVKEPADINALCDEYLRLAYHGLRAKDKHFNATLKTEFDASIGNINIVPQDIGRVMLNLFSNAFYAVSNNIKAEGESYQPLVCVQTKKLAGKVQIIVEDNGTGIPQNVISKIFQPFFTTKPTGQGTGLGLSLSYDIITKEHNGTIEVSSEEEKGSRFLVTLPV